MALRIIRPHEPIEVHTLVTCIYAVPGLGRTTLGFSIPDGLMLDADDGAHRAKNRRDVVQVKTWADVEGISADDMAPYSTLILDTVGRMLDVLTVQVIADNPKHGFGGVLNLQGWGALKGRFIAWLKHVRSFGKDVVFLCHSDEQKDGDETKERLDIQGGSKNEIYKL